MWLNADSTGTVYQEVQFSDTLQIVTIVSENSSYKGRVSSDGVVYFTGFTIGDVEPTHWTLAENQGPWFWGDVNLSGNFVQELNNLADTVVIPIGVYAPQGGSYYFNGTGTDFDNRSIPWNSDLNHYHLNLTTLPGNHKYDWWGSSVDSVSIGDVVIYDISGSHIRFEVVDSTHITLLDSLSGSYEVGWSDTSGVDRVELMISDNLGDRFYELVDQAGEWTRQVVLPSDSLIYLRVEADGTPQFTNVVVLNTELHHLVERDSSQYWFEFQIVNSNIVQDSSNVIATLNFNP